ncbi:MAG: sigma-54-dependent Fis family transcriptional regulator [Syntrophaceae bacterium]|nr:sigma-54-dependent Fis family transcriptional regulator [Syntrophaceae bacterium]
MRRTILIAEDEEKMRRILEVNLQDRYRILLAQDGEEALRIFKESPVNLILTDMKMPGKDGLSLLHEVKRLRPEIPVIVITAYGTIESAVHAMKEGATDYLLKPIKMEEVKLVIERALQQVDLIDENRQLREEIKSLYGIDTIISKHPKMIEMMEIVRQVADSKATVLIQGESGTGKELVARAIHFNSERAGFPFVVVNCSAIPRELLESELFGHEKGAFTGAMKRKIGSFESAHRGTLFLDEIGEMPKELQVKILRAIEGYRFTRLGGGEEIDVDVRLITATNRDLKAAVEAGEFREDLYYRLHVVTIKLPPLRERREDIPLLAVHFIEKHRKEVRGKEFVISDKAIQALENYSWPGNVRELENCMLRAMLLSRSNRIELEDLPPEVRGDEGETVHPVPKDSQELRRMKWLLKRKAEDELERIFLKEALKRNRGNISRTALDVGMDRRQLQNLIRKHRIVAREFKEATEKTNLPQGQ